MHNIEIEARLAALSAAIADRTRARMINPASNKTL